MFTFAWRFAYDGTIRYSDVEEAMTRANDTDFGLGGSVWTNDLDRGAKLAVR